MRKKANKIEEEIVCMREREKEKVSERVINVAW